jgi:hypothetical protein
VTLLYWCQVLKNKERDRRVKNILSLIFAFYGLNLLEQALKENRGIKERQLEYAFLAEICADIIALTRKRKNCWRKL